MAHLGSQRLTGRMVTVVLCLVLIPVLVYVLASSVTNDYTVGFFGRTGNDAARLKAWFASVILALVGVQVFLALWMYRKIPYTRRRGGQSSGPEPTAFRMGDERDNVNGSLGRVAWLAMPRAAETAPRAAEAQRRRPGRSSGLLAGTPRVDQ